MRFINLIRRIPESKSSQPAQLGLSNPNLLSRNSSDSVIRREHRGIVIFLEWPKRIGEKLQPFMSRRNLAAILILVILSLATSIRLLGIRYGLPYTFHTDEPTIVERALQMLRVGDYNPHFFNYPSLTIYLQAVVYALYFMVRVTEQTAHIIHIVDMPNHFFYLPGRLATALIGVVTVGLTYFVGKRMYGEEKGTRIGLMAALFLAVMPIHIEESRWITPNVPTGFFVLLSFYFAYLVWEEGEWYHYLFAGLSAGLAASAKYNGLLVIISLLIAHLLSPKRRDYASLLVGIMAFPIGFLIGTPYALIDPAQFLFGFRAEQIHYRFQGHQGAEHEFWWYAQYLYSVGAGQLLSLIAIIGFVYGFFKGWRKHLVLSVFPVLYFIVMSSFIVKFERNLIPMLPFLALWCAWGVEGVSALLWRAIQSWRTRYSLLVLMRIIIPLVIIVHPLSLGIEYGLVLTRTDTIIMAGKWVTDNLPKDSIVCYGYEEFAPHYIPPISESQFVVEPVTYKQLEKASPAFYRLCDYFIVNEQLFTPLPDWKLLQRFDPATLHHPGRRFGIYEVPSDNSRVMDEILEEFSDPAILSRLVWQQGADKASATIAESVLTIVYSNTQGVADAVFFDLPLNIDLREALALLLRVKLAQGSYLTLETVVDGQYWRPVNLNYYQGTGEWTTLIIPLANGQHLNAVRISVSEPDETPRTPRYALSIDWLKIRRIVPEP
jgi:4-amino-4-deoxy-L-arabinose transferase-like glycosyltransferase